MLLGRAIIVQEHTLERVWACWRRFASLVLHKIVVVVDVDLSWHHLGRSWTHHPWLLQRLLHLALLALSPEEGFQSADELSLLLVVEVLQLLLVVRPLRRH